MNIAINGMGRIGRAALKLIMDTKGLKLIAVNDIISIENLVYLIKYDTVYGIYEKEVSHEGQTLIVGDTKIQYTTIKNPAELPWRDHRIDVVIESTGLFTLR